MSESPGQERGVIAWMASNPVAANLLMLVVMAAGLQGVFSITKETLPTFPSTTLYDHRALSRQRS